MSYEVRWRSPTYEMIGESHAPWKVRLVNSVTKTGVRLGKRSRTIAVMENQRQAAAIIEQSGEVGMALGMHLSDTVDHGSWEEQRLTIPVLYVTPFSAVRHHTAFVVVMLRIGSTERRVFSAWNHIDPPKEAAKWLMRHIASTLPLA